MDDVVKVWNDYYMDGCSDTAIKDKHFFSLEVDSLVKQVCKASALIKKEPITILEIGVGTGYLASMVVKKINLLLGVNVQYVGVDFSDVAIKVARKRNIPGSKFIVSDFLDFMAKDNRHYDIIISQRSIMAVLDPIDQQGLLEMVQQHLKVDGMGIFSECTTQSLGKINSLREQLGVGPIEKVWHSLYLDQHKIENVFSSVSIVDFSSTYWLITRVIYPYFEEPKHNSPIHKFASKLPQTENYGLAKIFLVRP